MCTATSGTEALELAHKTPPDIVVLDIIMPDMDGHETLRRLRAISQSPVIIFSARDHTADEIVCLGADDYMRKPFDPDELVSRIGGILARCQ